MNLRFFSLSLAAIACIAFGGQVFGQAGNNNPGGVTADFHGSITTAGYYDPYTGNAKREITDIIVPGSIGAYPLQYTRTYNTRGHAGWSNNYTWDVTMYHRMDQGGGCNPEMQYCESVGHVSCPNGANFELEYSDPMWPLDANGRNGADDLLFDCAKASQCTSGAPFEIWRPDGGKILFEAAGNFSYRASAIIDPYGQKTTLTYNGSGQLWKVTEPGGRYLELTYAANGAGALSMVQANDGQGHIMESVQYGWENGVEHVYYDDGAKASYTYTQYMNSSGQMYAILDTCDDPRYAGPMKFIKYDYVQVSEGGQLYAMGQVKAERNRDGQAVSQITFPTSYNDPNLLIRTETRGDGASRTLDYRGAGGRFALTDFKNHTSSDQRLPDETGWQITDARQNVTTYEGAVGQLTKITYPQTDPTATPATKEFTYADPDYPYYRTGEKDENGNWTYFDWETVNGKTHVWRIRHPDQSTEQFTYNNLGQVLTHTLRNGGTESFEYDNQTNGIATRGLKTTYTPPATESDPAPSPHPTRYTYYQAADGHPTWVDRLKSVTDPLNHVTRYEYNNRGQVTKLIHYDNTYTQSSYNEDGTLAWSADENHPDAGLVGHDLERTRYEYDAYKRATKTWKPGETLPTTNCYALDPAWGTPQEKPLLHTTNNPKYTLSPLNKNVFFGYDENFRKIYESAAAFTPAANQTLFDYDEVGNLIWTSDPRQKETTFGYDQRNRKIWMNTPMTSDRSPITGHTMVWQYDGVGNKVKETRADDAFRTWEYHVPERTTLAIDWRMSAAEPASIVKQVTDLPSSTPYCTVTEHIYDPGNHEYAVVSDALGRKQSMSYPPAPPQAATAESWRYDEVGNIKTYTNRAGCVQTYAAPDDRNRPTAFTWSNEPPGQTTLGQSFEYDAKSRLRRTYNAETDITFTYDDADRKTSEREIISISGLGLNRDTTITWRHDADGNLQRTIYPAGPQFVYEYTQRNQLDTIKLDPAIYGSAYNTPAVDYDYDPAGNRTLRTLLNGGVTQYAPDDVNRVGALASYFANNKIGRFDYDYDKANRRKYEQRDFGLADGFGYDPTDQVTDYRKDGTLNVSNGTVTSSTTGHLGFDLSGNRTQVTGNWAPSSYAVNALNQYTSDVGGGAAGYDAKGNLASYAGWTVTYDAVNRLTELHNNVLNRHIIYKYDSLNRRVAQSVNGAVTSYVFDNWNQIEEHPTDGRQPRCYLFGAGSNEVVVSFGSGYQNYFYFQDGRGNTSHLTDNANNLVERYTYDLSGTVATFDGNGTLTGVSAADNHFLFAGAILLPETNLYDMRNRMYFPGWGRFLQADPIGFKGDASNLYRYCGNDPVDRTDPSGLVDRIWDAQMYMQGGATSTFEVVEKIKDLHSNGWVTTGHIEIAMAGKPGDGSVQSSNVSAFGLQTSQQGRQSLDYRTVGRGKNSWFIRWGLAHLSSKGGWIVQHIQAYWPNKGTDEYWEAWPVLPNEQFTATGSFRHFDDFWGPAGHPNSRNRALLRRARLAIFIPAKFCWPGRRLVCHSPESFLVDKQRNRDD